MGNKGFNSLYWGFLFIMVDFRIQGFDIFPDIIGYIFFAVGFGVLAAESTYFKKASNYNIPMLVLSIFAIYERPNTEPGFHFGPLGPLGILVGIAALVFSLLVVNNLFLGVKEMAQRAEQNGIYDEAGRRWTQFFLLQIAVIFSFIMVFIPFLNILYIIALLIVVIAYTIMVMRFMKECGQRL